MMTAQVTDAYQKRFFELRPGSLAWFLPSQVNDAGVVTGAPRGLISTYGLTISIRDRADVVSASMRRSGSENNNLSDARVSSPVSARAQRGRSSSESSMSVPGAGRSYFDIFIESGTTTQCVGMACDSPQERDSWIEALYDMAGKLQQGSVKFTVERNRKVDPANNLAKHAGTSFTKFSIKSRQNSQVRLLDDDDDIDHKCLICLRCGGLFVE